MFIPPTIVRARRRQGGRPGRPQRIAAAVVAAVASAVGTIAVAAGNGHIHGGPVAAALILVTLSVVVGLVVARTIGRQDRA